MIYCISDIHGCYSEFMELLDKIQFQDDDIVYVLGDVIDRRDDSIKCLQFVKNNPNMYLLMGNHEKMMLDALQKGGEYLDNWINLYGGDKTMEEFNRLSKAEQMDILRYISELPYYKKLEVGRHKFILVHAGVDLSTCMVNQPIDNIMNNQKKEDLVWIRDKFYGNEGIREHIIIFGHTSVYHLYGKRHSTKIWWDPQFKDKIGIDLGCHKGGGLMALRLDDLKEFYVCQRIYR